MELHTESSYLAAFLVALLGGVHCVGMCGGIVGALTFGLAEPAKQRFINSLPFLVAYNVGRISSYALAGILVGGVGAWAANLASVHHGQQVLQLVAGIFLVSLGLYLGGWWRGLAQLEQAGGLLWRRIEPLGRRLLPIRTVGQAWMVGLVWGWLPCGLVYSVLIWAISAGSALEGGLLMLSFGFGTLPMLFAMGVFAANLARFVRNPWVRYSAGILVICFGIYQILLLLI